MLRWAAIKENKMGIHWMLQSLEGMLRLRFEHPCCGHLNRHEQIEEGAKKMLGMALNRISKEIMESSVFSSKDSADVVAFL
jgi:hypothetical protein